MTIHKKSAAKGFTLVEILIAIAIVVILAVVVYLVYNFSVRSAYDSSIKYDVKQMESAQGRYMSLTNQGPVPYSSDDPSSNILSYASSKGNSVVVALTGADSYCIYGYNPGSSYPTIDRAFIFSSNKAPCPTLENTDVNNTKVVASTVDTIGQRLEEFHKVYGFYPHLNEIADVGLTIKPNNSNANQQQLYCRNDTNAIYAQIDTSSNILYVYQTTLKTVTSAGTTDKVTTTAICPVYYIDSSDLGYESTGVKSPDVSP